MQYTHIKRKLVEYSVYAYRENFDASFYGMDRKASPNRFEFTCIPHTHTHTWTSTFNGIICAIVSVHVRACARLSLYASVFILTESEIGSNSIEFGLCFGFYFRKWFSFIA